MDQIVIQAELLGYSVQPGPKPFQFTIQNQFNTYHCFNEHEGTQVVDFLFSEATQFTIPNNTEQGVA